MLGRLIAAALVALLCAARSEALTVESLDPDAVYTLKAVRIEGNSAVSDRTIRKVMLLAPPPFYKPWKAKPKFNPDLFRTDLERIATSLRESGYYEARISHTLELDGDQITIVLQIEEGPATTVGEVAIVAADFAVDETEAAALRRELVLAEGDVFTQEAYDQSRAKLERTFLERGFAYVEVAKSAVVDTETDVGKVTYTITRGIPAVFGTTAVSGTKRVAERLIRREITYQAGEAYDPRKIEETQANVFGLRLFRSVAVKPNDLAAKSSVVDMAITVTEGPPREVRIGVGYGLEDEFRGLVRWQHNDFFGGGRQLGFQLKGSSIEQAIAGEFRQPHFLVPQQSFVVPLTQSREDEPGFTVTRTRLAPRIERKFTPHFKGAVGYNIEYDDVTDVPVSTIALLEEFRASGFVSSITAVLERNTTLDLLDPREGSVLNLTAEQAGGPWQGDYGFYRAIFEAKKYWPVFGERVIAGRFRIGAGDGIDQSRDLPIFRRFYAGGINSTRGYGRHLVGPLNDDGDPVGGRSLLEGNLEFRTPVYKDFGAVAFVDAGQVGLEPFDYSPGDLQFGVGVGVRYKTLVGPIRLDFGIPLDPPPDEASWQIHFSIGQAF